ncbi:MAG: hypothetical protein CMN34_06035 [Saprospirales bacterium]|nr:hypothetical protein [Saprospirales bacterium]
MGVNLERNNVIHLDGYHWDKEKDDDKPLLSQLTDDLLANGFTDVGPEVIKLTISDSELTSFIDKFIVYHYDSDPSTVGGGAFGNAFEDSKKIPNYTVPAVNEHDHNKFVYDLPLGNGEDPTGQRFKYIHQAYADAERWNKRWSEFPTLNQISGTTSAASYLGPNSELFAYLNPHPSNMMTNETSQTLPSGVTNHQSRVKKIIFNIGADKYERVFNQLDTVGEEGSGVFLGSNQGQDAISISSQTGSLTGDNDSSGSIDDNFPLAKEIYPAAARFTEVAQFRVGQRVVGEQSGAIGVVTEFIDANGDPCVVGKNIFEKNMMYDPELLASVRGQTATHISDGTKSVLEFSTDFSIADFDETVDQVYTVTTTDSSDVVTKLTSTGLTPNYSTNGTGITFLDSAGQPVSVGNELTVTVSYGPKMLKSRLPSAGMVYGGNYVPEYDLPDTEDSTHGKILTRVNVEKKPYGNLQRKTVFIDEWVEQTEGRQLVVEALSKDFFPGEKIFSENPFGDDDNSTAELTGWAEPIDVTVNYENRYVPFTFTIAGTFNAQDHDIAVVVRPYRLVGSGTSSKREASADDQFILEGATLTSNSGQRLKNGGFSATQIQYPSGSYDYWTQSRVGQSNASESGPNQLTQLLNAQIIVTVSVKEPDYTTLSRIPPQSTGFSNSGIQTLGEKGDKTGDFGALTFSKLSRFSAQTELTNVADKTTGNDVVHQGNVGTGSAESLSFRIEFEREKSLLDKISPITDEFDVNNQVIVNLVNDSLGTSHQVGDSFTVSSWDNDDVRNAATTQYFPALVVGWIKSRSPLPSGMQRVTFDEQNEYDGRGASPTERMSYVTLDMVQPEESNEFIVNSGEGKTFLKKDPQGGVISGTGYSTGYVGIGTVAKLVYENEYNKVKRCLINSARGVKFSPEDVTTGLSTSTEASLVQYKEEELVQGNKHHFWIALDKSETFFTSDQIEPKPLLGSMTLSMKTEDDSSPSPMAVTGMQLGDVYTFTLQRIKGRYTGTSSDVLFGDPVIVQITVESTSISDFALELSNELNDNLPEYSFEIDSENTSNILFRSNEVGFDLSIGYNSVNYSESLEPVRVESDRANFGMGSVDTSTRNASSSPVGVTAINGSFGVAVKDSSDANGNYYLGGYHHKVDFALPSEAYYGDKFEFVLSGLITQSSTSETYTTPSTFDLTLEYIADRRFSSSAALGAAIKNSVITNSYISKFMKVSLESNLIKFEYTPDSWAYLDKTTIHNQTGAYGLMNENSSKYSTVYTTGSSDSDPFSSVITAATGLADDSFLVIMNEMTSNGYTDIPTNVSLYDMEVWDGTQYINNTMYVSDLPSESVFTGQLTVTPMTQYDFTDDDTGGLGPLQTIGFVRSQLPSSLVRQKVKIKFPFARDFGTFADPITHLSDAVGASYNNSSTSSADATTHPTTLGGNTKYFTSYKQHVIGAAGPRFVSEAGTTYSSKGFISQGDRKGPETSFDPDLRGFHPEVSVSDNYAHYSSFPYHECGLELESFELISDHSIGPVVLETNDQSNLGGVAGDQPWRIRFEVSRGYEVTDASPFIATQNYQGVGGSKGNTEFEYLKVHVATEYQIKGDGTVTSIQSADGLEKGEFREPGFLGGVRPQYSGYVRARTHLISPEVTDFLEVQSLQSIRTSGLNPSAGIVGFKDYNKVAAGTEDERILGGGTSDGTETTKAEFRYEDKYLRGSSTELVYDTPFNTGTLRMQKGFFRRTGKQERSVALTYPMSYTLTVADHGIVFYLRDQAASAQSDDYAWFVIQRHVDSTTGVPDYDSLSQPVHCVYQTSEPPLLYSDLTPFFSVDESSGETIDRTTSIFVEGLTNQFGSRVFDFRVDEFVEQELKAFDIENQGRFRRFVVREKDVLKPWDRHVFAGISETDSHAVLNILEQLALNEDGQLVIQFPNRLGSQRYFFTGKELDLIAFSDGGAVGQDTLITSDRFSTTGTTDKRRLYKALMSTKPFGNGMRVLAMVAGYGITSSQADTRLLSS